MPPEQRYCIYKWRPPVNLNTLQLLGANISYPEIIQNKDSYGDDGDSIFTYFWNIFIHPWVKLWKTIRHTGQRSWHSMKRSWQWGGMRLKIRSRGNMKPAIWPYYESGTKTETSVFGELQLLPCQSVFLGASVIEQLKQCYDTLLYITNVLFLLPLRKWL